MIGKPSLKEIQRARIDELAASRFQAVAYAVMHRGYLRGKKLREKARKLGAIVPA